MMSYAAYLFVCFMVLLNIEWHDYTAMFQVCCEMGLFGTVRSVWCGLLSNSPFESAGAFIFTPAEPCESVQGVLWQKNQLALTFYLHQMFTFLVSCWKHFGFPHGDGWQMDLSVTFWRLVWFLREEVHERIVLSGYVNKSMYWLFHFFPLSFLLGCH